MSTASPQDAPTPAAAHQPHQQASSAAAQAQRLMTRDEICRLKLTQMLRDEYKAVHGMEKLIEIEKAAEENFKLIKDGNHPVKIFKPHQKSFELTFSGLSAAEVNTSNEQQSASSSYTDSPLSASAKANLPPAAKRVSFSSTINHLKTPSKVERPNFHSEGMSSISEKENSLTCPPKPEFKSPSRKTSLVSSPRQSPLNSPVKEKSLLQNSPGRAAQIISRSLEGSQQSALMEDSAASGGRSPKFAKSIQFSSPNKSRGGDSPNSPKLNKTTNLNETHRASIILQKSLGTKNVSTNEQSTTSPVKIKKTSMTGGALKKKKAPMNIFKVANQSIDRHDSSANNEESTLNATHVLNRTQRQSLLANAALDRTFRKSIKNPSNNDNERSVELNETVQVDNSSQTRDKPKICQPNANSTVYSPSKIPQDSADHSEAGEEYQSATALISASTMQSENAESESQISGSFLTDQDQMQQSELEAATGSDFENSLRARELFMQAHKKLSKNLKIDESLIDRWSSFSSISTRGRSFRENVTSADPALVSEKDRKSVPGKKKSLIEAKPTPNLKNKSLRKDSKKTAGISQRSASYMPVKKSKVVDSGKKTRKSLHSSKIVQEESELLTAKQNTPSTRVKTIKTEQKMDLQASEAQKTKITHSTAGSSEDDVDNQSECAAANLPEVPQKPFKLPNERSVSLKPGKHLAKPADMKSKTRKSMHTDLPIHHEIIPTKAKATFEKSPAKAPQAPLIKMPKTRSKSYTNQAALTEFSAPSTSHSLLKKQALHNTLINKNSPLTPRRSSLSTHSSECFADVESSLNLSNIIRRESDSVPICFKDDQNESHNTSIVSTKRPSLLSTSAYKLKPPTPVKNIKLPNLTCYESAFLHPEETLLSKDQTSIVSALPKPTQSSQDLTCGFADSKLIQENSFRDATCGFAMYQMEDVPNEAVNVKSTLLGTAGRYVNRFLTAMGVQTSEEDNHSKIAQKTEHAPVESVSKPCDAEQDDEVILISNSHSHQNSVPEILPVPNFNDISMRGDSITDENDQLTIEKDYESLEQIPVADPAVEIEAINESMFPAKKTTSVEVKSKNSTPKSQIGLEIVPPLINNYVNTNLSNPMCRVEYTVPKIYVGIITLESKGVIQCWNDDSYFIDVIGIKVLEGKAEIVDILGKTQVFKKSEEFDILQGSGFRLLNPLKKCLKMNFRIYPKNLTTD